MKNEYVQINPPRKVFVWLAIIGIIAATSLVILLTISNRQGWQECEDKGGHMYARGRTTICVDSDGRVIEI